MKNFDFSYKIKNLDDAILWRNNLKNEGKKVVITNGCFDLIHRGHLTYLIKARIQGDALLVAVNSDESIKKLKGPSRPIINQEDRLFTLSCFPFVDTLLIFETLDCSNLLEKLRPDIYVKGGDYTLETIPNTEREVLNRVGSEIKFLSYVDGYSSSKIIKSISKFK